MKIGDSLKVLTSVVFANQVGKIVCVCKKTITVNFNGMSGIYTYDKNEFQMME